MSLKKFGKLVKAFDSLRVACRYCKSCLVFKKVNHCCYIDHAEVIECVHLLGCSRKEDVTFSTLFNLSLECSA